MTLSPTARPQFSFQDQVGGFGIRSTGITATGTLDNKLGYAFAAGRLGEYGDFSPGPVAQGARPNNASPNSVNPNGACEAQNANGVPNDVSACNLALNTYFTSQNTEQSVLLGKLAYSLSPVTKLTATAYDAVQWSDSTGNGDNDYLPYSTRLNQVNQNTSDCTTPGGAAGYTVTTNPLTGATSCYTAQQWAASSYGPDGGGAGRQRSTRMGDYHLSFTTSLGNNNITLDGYPTVSCWEALPSPISTTPKVSWLQTTSCRRPTISVSASRRGTSSKPETPMNTTAGSGSSTTRRSSLESGAIFYARITPSTTNFRPS